MKKIIHMSDLHVGYKDLGDKLDLIIRSLIFEKGDRASDYVIVITGDLVDNANEKDSYKNVINKLDVLKKSGFENILVVPGNHDYGTGDHGDKKFVKKFQLAFYGKEIEFPKVDIIDKIAFIGLDSMADELNWYDELFAEGELGKKQLSNLTDILNNKIILSCEKRVVYMHHHPFHFRPLHHLKDSKKLENILTNVIQTGISIDAFLYGHNHEGNIHNGKWGIPRCYDAGTATLKPRPKYINWSPWYKSNAAIRIIDLYKNPVSDYVFKVF